MGTNESNRASSIHTYFGALASDLRNAYGRFIITYGLPNTSLEPCEAQDARISLSRF